MKGPQSTKKRATMHYWTGRGTLCSPSSAKLQNMTHTPVWRDVTCKRCLVIKQLNDRNLSGGQHG